MLTAQACGHSRGSEKKWHEERKAKSDVYRSSYLGGAGAVRCQSTTNFLYLIQNRHSVNISRVNERKWIVGGWGWRSDVWGTKVSLPTLKYTVLFIESESLNSFSYCFHPNDERRLIYSAVQIPSLRLGMYPDSGSRMGQSLDRSFWQLTGCSHLKSTP